ncbi:MAG: type II toxin-antitoxin system PemK/MazF family toxin [Oscillospiraceae bacterium]|nr:type II toxin-antitoxin system PemK/MazF family toxin [Oscillospiraceae bacterium]
MSIELTNAQQFLSWMNTKSRLNAIAPNAAKRAVSRGQVYWCHFGLNIGSEISKTTQRPAVVVSNFRTNKNSANVIVVPVTHNKNQLPYLVPLTPITDTSGKVILDGQVDTADVICVSKARLGDIITKLSDAQMKSIDKSLAISLELIHYFNEEEDKYSKLEQYVAKLKAERNTAQDILKSLKDTISQNGFDEKGQEKIRELLDI